MSTKSKLITFIVVGCSIAGGLMLSVGDGTTQNSETGHVGPQKSAPLVHRRAHRSQNSTSSRTKNRNDLESASNLRTQIHTLIQSEGPWLEKLHSLAELCEQLVGEIGLREALLAAQEDAGPGKVRDWMITAMVGASADPLGDVLELVNTLEGANEIRAGLTGVMTMIRRSVPDPDQYRYLKLSPSEVEAVAAALAMKVGSSVRGEPDFDLHQAFDLLELSHGDRSISDKTIKEFLDHASRLQPLQALEFGMMKLGSGSLSGMEIVIINAVRTAPSKTMDILVERATLDSHASATNLFKFGIAEWLQVNTNAVTSWIDAKSDELPASQKDMITGVLVQHSLKGGKLQDAWELVNEIKDPEARRVAEGHVWGKERDVVRKFTNQDPPGTLESMIQGRSQHADYWIEEAMVTWIAKEPEKAEAWYRKTWSSLPPAKAQYVAAAYAKEALRLGDPATARQWTSLIQDPKTKERINASINKAASNQGQ